MLLDPCWSEDELAQVEAHANGQTRLEPPAQTRPGIGGRRLSPSSWTPGSLDNDPLARLTLRQIFRDCIWVSDEDTNTKIMLLCIERYMDKDLRGSSMSYAQIAEACGFSDSTAIRSARAARDRWLRIEVSRGRYVPGKGNENLYHGIIPERWAEELRRQRSRGQYVKIDERIVKATDDIVAGMTGVSHGHPEQDSGVSDSHPEAPSGVSHRHRGVPQTEPGCPTDTLTPNYSLKKKRETPLPKVASPTQKEIDAGFTEWWEHYPRKDDKLEAKKSYTAIVTGTHNNPECRATIPQLLAALKTHKFPKDREFTKLPATWLNKGSWASDAVDERGAEDAWVAEQMRTARGIERIQSLGREKAEKMLRAAYRAQLKQEGHT